jgi:hypothetical protein
VASSAHLRSLAGLSQIAGRRVGSACPIRAEQFTVEPVRRLAYRTHRVRCGHPHCGRPPRSRWRGGQRHSASTPRPSLNRTGAPQTSRPAACRVQAAATRAEQHRTWPRVRARKPPRTAWRDVLEGRDTPGLKPITNRSTAAAVEASARRSSSSTPRSSSRRSTSRTLQSLIMSATVTRRRPFSRSPTTGGDQPSSAARSAWRSCLRARMARTLAAITALIGSGWAGTAPWFTIPLPLATRQYRHLTALSRPR